MTKVASNNIDLHKFTASLSSSDNQRAMVMLTNLVKDEGLARNVIVQGSLGPIRCLPKERSSEVASLLLALAGSSEDNANLLVNASNVLDMLAGLIKDREPTGVLVAKRIAGYIGSPAKDAIRGSDEIVVGLCEIAATAQDLSISIDALDTIADLAWYNVHVQGMAGKYLDAFVKRLNEDGVSESLIRVISCIVDNNYDNQMKFIEILSGDEEHVKLLLSKRNGVSCIRNTLRHNTKHSAQRTKLCMISVFRKIVMDQCNANDTDFKALLKVLCSGHSGNYSRFVADGFVFPEELNINKSFKKRKAADAADAAAASPDAASPAAADADADAAAPDSKCVKPNEPATVDPKGSAEDVPEIHRLKCENDMLRAEIEHMRCRLVSAVCQRNNPVV